MAEAYAWADDQALKEIHRLGIKEMQRAKPRNAKYALLTLAEEDRFRQIIVRRLMASVCWLATEEWEWVPGPKYREGMVYVCWGAAEAMLARMILRKAGLPCRDHLMVTARSYIAALRERLKLLLDCLEDRALSLAIRA
jgi:hypothetical protein